ncbi:M23 family metallopeptidase [Luteimonas yindakuii]|uniref:M23 family metallopeptidase n=1 Tax=Luteimonas yindakuii TaxID=2565782 RepID=UPI0010A2F8D5|nr:M23 family metallopeptidase [Luteimonas yindakuii]QCO67166.1 M23 family metallopeptidase [Luteimonas yindakuii]
MRLTAAIALLLAAALAVWAWWARPVRVAPSATVATPVANGDAAGLGAESPGWVDNTGVAPPVRSPADAPTDQVPGTGLLIPVQGIDASQLADTFTDARSEGRQHDAIDIMAPAGTPVLAVADGHVEKLFDSERGGLTVYQFEPSGRFAYYYGHLQAYAPGLAEGLQVRRGDVLGTVGTTGNASDDAPHLHFAIFRLGAEKRWWEGDAINPYPHLREGTLPR